MPGTLEHLQQLIELCNTSSGQKLVIDGGCNIGQFALAIIQNFRNPNIISFEPDPESYRCARKNLNKFSQIEIVEAALGKSKMTAEFFRGPNSATNSLLPRPNNQAKQYYPSSAQLTGGQYVTVLSLDDFCAEREITDIDLLKLDLQGGELDALRGSNSLLESNRIKVILTEAVFIEKYRNQPLLHDLWRFLSEYGYSLFSLEDLTIGPYDAQDTSLRQHQWNQCDAIFINTEIRRNLDRL